MTTAWIAHDLRVGVGCETPYVDHVPNPKVVARFARACSYDIDILAFELMVGRWEIEVRDNYTNPGNMPES